MRVLQSFWTLPLLEKKDLRISSRSLGGFSDKLTFYCCWTLSVLSIRKFYGSLELHTDSLGLYIFKKTLQLPYTQYYDTLNHIDNIPTELWSYGKALVYNQISEPFVHIDGDIIIHGKADFEKDSQIILEFLDNNISPDIKEIINRLSKKDFPYSIECKNIVKKNVFPSPSMGIFYTKDASLTRNYFSKLLNFYSKVANSQLFKPEDIELINVVGEQIIFYEYLQSLGVSVAFLKEEPFSYGNFLERILSNRPYAGHTHYISQTKSIYSNFIIKQLRRFYPVYFNRIYEAISKGSL